MPGELTFQRLLDPQKPELFGQISDVNDAFRPSMFFNEIIRPPVASGASSSAVPEVGSSGAVPLIVPPPISREIIYTGVGLRQYRVPDVSLQEGYLSFLGDRPDDEVVSIRVGDLRSIYTDSFCNFNLLQYLGREPPSFSAGYRRTVEASFWQDDPVYVSRSQSRSKSRKSDSRTSRRSRSSAVRPAASVRTVEVFSVHPCCRPTSSFASPEARETSEDSESVSKCSRQD